MSPALPPILLALSEADQPTLVFWIITALVATGPAAYYWLKIWDRFHPDPADQSKLATKEELETERIKVRQELAEVEKRIAVAHKMEIQGLENRLGTIQTGMHGIESSMREIFGELRALHRSLGKAEGILASQD